MTNEELRDHFAGQVLVSITSYRGYPAEDLADYAYEVADAMLATAGFELTDRGTVEVVNEWPDVDTAVRALAAAGPSIPAIHAIGRDAFCQALRDLGATWYDHRLGVRVSSEFDWVTARPR